MKEAADIMQDVKATMVRKRDQAWNRHDARAIASLFAREIDFVDVNGSRFWQAIEVVR